MIGASTNVGDLKITLLQDGFFQTPSDDLQHQGGAQKRAATLAKWGNPVIRIPVNCFLLQRGSKAMLVDTGAGTAWGDEYGQIRADLDNIGITPDMISEVYLTHLHGDHALGLFAGETLYFPKATVYASAVELTYFTNNDIRAKLPVAAHGAFDTASKLTALLGDRLVPTQPGEFRPGISLLPLPGHTPGHSGFTINNAERSVLIWGDTVHLPSLQAIDPEVGIIFDTDGRLAAQTRHAILADAAANGTIVAGGHIDGFQKVTPNGDGYALTTF